MPITSLPPIPESLKGEPWVFTKVADHGKHFHTLGVASWLVLCSDGGCQIYVTYWNNGWQDLEQRKHTILQRIQRRSETRRNSQAARSTSWWWKVRRAGFHWDSN